MTEEEDGVDHSRRLITALRSWLVQVYCPRESKMTRMTKMFCQYFYANELLPPPPQETVAVVS